MPDWFPGILLIPVRIVFLVLVAFILLVIVRWVINRIIEQTIKEPQKSRFALAEKLRKVNPHATARRSQRLRALGSLAKSAVTVVITVITVLMVLAELGFNVATLVAGTSIVGVTLAFGLQNVIKDLVSGLFMLAEDQLGVGDVVDMKQAGIVGGGTVESVGLRVTQLRTDDGTISYVRNGEVTRVLNFSQGGPGKLPDPDES